MDFTQEVYIDNKRLVLTTDKEAYMADHHRADSYISFYGATLKNFNQAIQQLGNPGCAGVLIEDVSPDSLLGQLHAMFHLIDAGGGVVLNERGEVLMIFRRGKWDLPKGKLDKGEDIEACALREVQEETGLETLELREKICDTYHVYNERNVDILKRTAWYKMKGSSTDKLKPQKEENIIDARWVAQTDLAPLAANSYEAIREVLYRSGLRSTPVV